MTPAAAGPLPPDDWNATGAPFRDDIPIGTMLLEAAARYAAEPALITGPPGHPVVFLSYAGLYAEARRLAQLLRQTGRQAGDHVGVVGHHSPATVAGILGCLLAGLTYVPVDPRWPPGRKCEVLAAVGAAAVVAAPSDATWLAGAPAVRHVVTPFAGAAEEPWRAETALLWDSIAQSPGHAEAAGFNLGPAPVTADQAEHYAAHVAGLVASTEPVTVAEIGFGSGLVLRHLATPAVSLLSGIEPAATAVGMARQWAAGLGLFADFVEGFADEIDVALPGPHDTVLLASVIQFFPDEQYLHHVLTAVARVVRPGGTVVLADVIPPGQAPADGLLELPPSFFRTLPSGVWEPAEIRDRVPREWPPVLGVRYDVLLRRSAGPPPPRMERAAAGPDHGAHRVWTSEDIARQTGELPVPGPSADDSAYVIFTSGSTGSPKGVRIGHRSVVNLVQWILGKYRLGPGDIGLQVVSFSFDLSVFDVAGILSSGAALRLIEDARLAEPSEVATVLETEPVTFWNSAPAALGWVLPFAQPGRGRLRLVFLSGDWIPLTMPENVRAFAPAAVPVSLGGATETTVWSNDYRIAGVDPKWPSVPYGRPMPNARYYVLDDELRVVPVGAEGDLFIAGACLAEGYHADPAQTAIAFVPDVVTGRGRMYRTGDRARWLPDGELEFLGRRDHQVKIRGFRVELGEIESVIGRQRGVHAAAVVPVAAGGDRQLAGFYIGGPDPGIVRAACVARLPAYCVPVLLDRLGSLPVTANGKIDRKALADRAAARIATWST